MASGGCVYIIASADNTMLYVGVTSDLYGRIKKHKDEYYPNSFSKKYGTKKLVYYERFERIVDAIKREKQMKKYSHVKKVLLIIAKNPKWDDLHEQVRYF